MSKTYLSLNKKYGPETLLPPGEVMSDDEKGSLQTQQFPLRHTWVLWEQLQQAQGRGQADYKNNTRPVKTISTVQEFWAVWNHLPQPSELLESQKIVRQSADGVKSVDAIMLFKDGVKPAWEDEANKHGGSFNFSIQKKDNLPPGQVDEYWNNLILGIIGGTIQPPDFINGVRLVDKLHAATAKAGLRIEVWFANMGEGEKVKALIKSAEDCVRTRMDGTTSNGLKADGARAFKS